MFSATLRLPADEPDQEMRQEVSATTNKIEYYHAFIKWLDFGGEVINENDPNEQQKRVLQELRRESRYQPQTSST